MSLSIHNFHMTKATNLNLNDKYKNDSLTFIAIIYQSNQPVIKTGNYRKNYRQFPSLVS